MTLPSKRASAETETDIQNLDDSYFAETLDYIVEIHELGICKTNPIQNTTWLKKDNVILWKGKNNISLEVNVGPGKKMPGNITLGKMPNGEYNYSYILLKKTVKAKAKASLIGQTFFSKNDKTAIGDENGMDFLMKILKILEQILIINNLLMIKLKFCYLITIKKQLQIVIVHLNIF